MWKGQASTHFANDPDTANPWLPSRTRSDFGMRKVIFDPVGEIGRLQPAIWSRNNHGNTISLIRLAWLCVRDPRFTRFSALNWPKFDPSSGSIQCARGSPKWVNGDITSTTWHRRTGWIQINYSTMEKSDAFEELAELRHTEWTLSRWSSYSQPDCWVPASSQFVDLRANSASRQWSHPAFQTRQIPAIFEMRSSRVGSISEREFACSSIGKPLPLDRRRTQAGRVI